MNSFQKFFRDYPIIWIIVVVLFIGLGIGYWFFKPKPIIKTQVQQIKPVKSEIVKSIPVKKPERTVKITPVSIVTPLVTAAKQVIEKTEIQKEPQKLIKPQIVFVIDDLGYNKRQAELLFSIPLPLTIAILPQLTYSKYFAEEGKKHGFETILHQPLEPENKSEDPGPGVITTNMTVEQIKLVIEENLSTVPDVIGVNNHMGSHATRDRRVMYVLGKELKKRNLFFLDSMTHSESVANHVTFALRIPTAKRDVFLDNKDDYNSIVERIKETAEVAKKNGKAIAIGHIRQNTLQAIKDLLPKLEADGYEIVTLKELLESDNVIAPKGLSRS